MNPASLERDIADIKRQLAARSVLIPAVQRDAYTLLVVGQGNTIWSGSTAPALYGCNYTGSGMTAVSAIPTAAPTGTNFTSAAGTLTTGLAAAKIYGTSTYVWISTKPNNGTTTFTDLTVPIPEGTVVACRKSTLVAVTGGGGSTGRVYIPWRI